MDNVRLGGPRTSVTPDVNPFRSEGAKLGLNLNVSKCEVIFRDQRPFKGPSRAFSRINPSVLLSSPRPGIGTANEAALEAQCSDLRIAIGRLKNNMTRSFFNAPHLPPFVRET